MTINAILILAGFLFLSVMCNVLQLQHSHVQTAELTTCSTQIQDLEAEQKEKAKQYQAAQTAAYVQVKKIQDDTAQIMTTKVSPICSKAMQYLKDMSKEIHP